MIDREELRYMWEETPVPASWIAQMYGVTKNVVIGIVYRAGWKSFNQGPPRPYVPTLYDRMDALEAQMNEVLAQTQATLEKYRSTYDADREKGPAGISSPAPVDVGD